MNIQPLTLKHRNKRLVNTCAREAAREFEKKGIITKWILDKKKNKEKEGERTDSESLHNPETDFDEKKERWERERERERERKKLVQL